MNNNAKGFKVSQYWTDMANILSRMKRFRKAVVDARIKWGIPEAGLPRGKRADWYGSFFLQPDVDINDSSYTSYQNQLLPPNKLIRSTLSDIINQFNLDKRWLFHLFTYISSGDTPLSPPTGLPYTEVRLNDCRLPKIVLFHQTQGTNVGTWEYARVQSYSGTTLTLTTNLTNSYSSSGSNKAQVRVVPQYNNVTVNSGVTWSAKAWNGTTGGILAFLAKGTVSVSGKINTEKTGFRPGSGTAIPSKTGEGTVGPEVNSHSANGNGGGGGDQEFGPPAQSWGSGAGGGHATAGGNGIGHNGGVGGTGGSVVGNATLTQMNFGGGGGYGYATPGNDGIGGGIAFIQGKTVTVNSGGSLDADGGAAGGTPNVGTAGSGGGAGGSILLKGESITLGTSLATSTGGAGADAGWDDGGAGGVGRIRAEYETSITGSTNPAASTSQNTIPDLPAAGIPPSTPYNPYVDPDTSAKYTQSSYDPIGRANIITNPKGDSKTIAYDHWKETTIDENGHIKREFKNGFDKINKVEEVNGINTYTTTYEYDSRDLLTKITDNSSNQSTFAYDSLGRKTSQTDPDMGTWTYAYDGVGNLTSQTDNRNITTTKTYDELDRLTLINYPTNTDTTYTYDGNSKIGTLTTAVDKAGTVNYSYDNRLRKTQEQRTVNGTTKTLQFAYDPMDRLLSQTYPDGEVVTFSFNNQGEIESAIGSTSLLTNIDYNALGKITKKDFGNGLTTNYTYNTNDFRLNRIQTGTLQDLGYTYDAVGNVKTRTNNLTSKTETFGYDDLDRLKTASESAGGYNQAYTYNPIGNLTKFTNAGVDTDYTYGANGKPHSMTSSTGIQAPTPTPTSTITTFNPTEDAHVDASLATSNFGTSTEIGVDGDPVKIAFLKFNLSSLAGRKVTNAKLRMYISNGSASTQNIKEASTNNWTETGLTYNNRPTLVNALGSIVSQTTTNVWNEVDLTNAIASHAGQIYSVGLDSSGTDGLGFNSRDAASNKVELVVTHENGGYPGALLSQGKTIVASSQKTGYEATKANDGALSGSYWESLDNSYPSTLTVDLGSIQTVSKVVMKLDWGGRIENVEILGSTDNSTFTTIVPAADYVLNTMPVTFSPTNVRYVRLKVNSNNSAPAAQMAEFEVYGPAMSPATPVVRSSTSGSVSSGGLTLNKPTGTVDGDLLIMTASADLSASEDVTYTIPSGWTQLLANTRSDVSSAGNNLQVWYKIASSEPTNYTITPDHSNLIGGSILRIDGHDQNNPINVQGLTATTTGEASAPSVTTTVDNALVLRLVTWDQSKTVVAVPSGHTQTYHVDVNGHDSWGGYKEQLTAGSTGVAQFDLSAASPYVGLTVAIKPGSSNPTTIYEAENGTLSGPVVASNNPGYSGTGFADYLNASNDYVEWTVNAAATATATLEFRYANGGASDRPLELKVNGIVVNSSLSFPVTANWSTWAFATQSASLNAGSNTIRLTAVGSNGANIDYLKTTQTVSTNITSYTYDANGNMTSDGTNCYQINEANQIDKVYKCSNSQTIAEYVYDYMGNRMVKRNFTNGTLANTVTSWSDSYETQVVEGGATTNTSYYFVNGQLIAKKDNGGNRTFFHNDHLGSTSVVTNSSGSLVEETKYDPWGKVNIGGTASKFLYTGQEKDSETGLHYYNARYYNSDIRRFTQPDDIIQDIYNPQGLNRYSYVWNNPLRYTDPTGHLITVRNGRLVDTWGIFLPSQPKKPQTYQQLIQSMTKPSNNKGTQARQSVPSQRSNGSNSRPSQNVSAPQGSSGAGGGSGSAGSTSQGSSSPTSLQTNMVKGASTSKSNLGIVGGCLNGNAGLGVYGSASGCVHYSFAENKWGVTGTLGGGGTTGVTVGGGVSFQFSNAQRFSDLLGQDVFAGGSAGAFLQGTLDYSWNVDNTNIQTADIGGGVGGSFSLPVYPVEGHGGSTYTWGKSF